jgi:hypothetical protein
MAEPTQTHEYPGQLQERHGGPIPTFLKLTYLGFTLFGLIYFALYYAGDGAPLVKLLNAATGHGAP